MKLAERVLLGRSVTLAIEEDVAKTWTMLRACRKRVIKFANNMDLL